MCIVYTYQLFQILKCYQIFPKKIELEDCLYKPDLNFSKNITGFWHPKWKSSYLDPENQIFVDSLVKKQPSRGVLEKRCSKNMQQIYRRTSMPKCTLAWMFSCKFATYFQNTFSYEHLWVAASVGWKTEKPLWKFDLWKW